MDRQEIFNKVATHLLKQNKQAITSDGLKYMYETDEGLRCAIGCLIPDGHEGLKELVGVQTLVKRYVDLGTLWGVENEHDIVFLGQLQDIHDLAKSNKWKELLRDCAADHGLNMNVLDG